MRLDFDVPAAIVTALGSGSYSRSPVRQILLNVPSPGRYLLDDLSFTGTGREPGRPTRGGLHVHVYLVPSDKAVQGVYYRRPGDHRADSVQVLESVINLGRAFSLTNFQSTGLPRPRHQNLGGVFLCALSDEGQRQLSRARHSQQTKRARLHATFPLLYAVQTTMPQCRCASEDAPFARERIVRCSVARPYPWQKNKTREQVRRDKDCPDNTASRKDCSKHSNDHNCNVDHEQPVHGDPPLQTGHDSAGIHKVSRRIDCACLELDSDRLMKIEEGGSSPTTNSFMLYTARRGTRPSYPNPKRAVPVRTVLRSRFPNWPALRRCPLARKRVPGLVDFEVPLSAVRLLYSISYIAAPTHFDFSSATA